MTIQLCCLPESPIATVHAPVTVIVMLDVSTMLGADAGSNGVVDVRGPRSFHTQLRSYRRAHYSKLLDVAMSLHYSFSTVSQDKSMNTIFGFCASCPWSDIVAVGPSVIRERSLVRSRDTSAKRRKGIHGAGCFCRCAVGDGPWSGWFV